MKMACFKRSAALSDSFLCISELSVVLYIVALFILPLLYFVPKLKLSVSSWLLFGH